jgi:hypothetical protein
MITEKTLSLININRTIISIFIGFVVVSLSVFYIFQIIKITQESYLVMGCQEELQELSQNNGGLKIYFTENKSLDNIESLAQELNYEKIGQIHYIQTIDNVVAAK